MALAPFALAYSRYHEHEADRFSLDLTHMNRSAARAFADLQRENLGVPAPLSSKPSGDPPTPASPSGSSSVTPTAPGTRALYRAKVNPDLVGP